MPDHQKAEILTDHLFRHEYGKMVAVLIHKFGSSQLSLIEDVVQDTFIKALQSWKMGNVPDNPQGWLHRVARNRAIDLIRSQNAFSKRNLGYTESLTAKDYLDEPFLEEEISDSQLRLIFMCCHLGLNEQDTIAITLKLVSGFGIKEIAKALMQKEDTIKKRLQRARKRLQKNEKQFFIPSGNQFVSSIHTVNKILYLIFNEGYQSCSKEEFIRKDLCAEAMRLGKMIDDHTYCQNADTAAMIALMCYHSARLDSRKGDNNELILLEYQDRSKWYQPLIQIGHYYYKKSTDTEQFSIYHLEAAIAAQHVMAPTFKDTNWHILLQLYKKLSTIRSSPIINLNLAIVYRQLQEPEKALNIVSRLSEDMFLPNPYLFHAVTSSIYHSYGNHMLAVKHLKKALTTVENRAEKTLLQNRLTQLIEG